MTHAEKKESLTHAQEMSRQQKLLLWEGPDTGSNKGFLLVIINLFRELKKTMQRSKGRQEGNVIVNISSHEIDNIL